MSSPRTGRSYTDVAPRTAAALRHVTRGRTRVLCGGCSVRPGQGLSRRDCPCTGSHGQSRAHGIAVGLACVWRALLPSRAGAGAVVVFSQALRSRIPVANKARVLIQKYGVFVRARLGAFPPTCVPCVF